MYKYTKRGVAKYFFLGIITLGIYELVALGHIRFDVMHLTEKTEKKPMRFAGVFFLSIITLGIVGLVWWLRICGRTGRECVRQGINSPKTSGPRFFWFCWIPVAGWFIAMHNELKCLNLLCIKANKETAPVKEVAAKEAEPEKAKEIEAKPVEAKPVEPEAVEAKPVAKPVEKKASPAKPKAKPAPKAAEKSDSKSHGRVYHIAYRADANKWAIKGEKDEKAIKLFTTQAEAIEYAKALVKSQDASVRVHGRDGKIRSI